jgi:glycosyltransferase involved in cell wall biosynthesis
MKKSEGHDMHVCLISVEIFAWGKYGGFGRDTRIIGRELVKRGLQVSVVVPRRAEQRPIEELDGMRILSFPPGSPFSASDLFRQSNADIYHSFEPSLNTYLAMRAMPDRRHIITFLDPRIPTDWLTELRLPSVNHMQVLSNWLYEDNWLVHRAAHRADGWFTPAYFIVPKIRDKYRLPEDPRFLPTPVALPEQVQKSPDPTVCYIGRWDRRKRPELFFELVKSFPQVRFLAAGQSRDAEWENDLREKYGDLPNLELLGFIDQFNGDKLWRVFNQSWILVNTAAREGLPNALKEAAAHGCAILSSVDPDGFASRFGYHAQQDDFVAGLNELLHDNTWQERGMQGREYVRQVFEIKNAIDQHIRVYQRLLNAPASEL